MKPRKAANRFTPALNNITRKVAKPRPARLNVIKKAGGRPSMGTVKPYPTRNNKSVFKKK